MTIGFYDEAGVRGARVAVPQPRRQPCLCGNHVQAPAIRTISEVNALGRRRWKREAGYHRQARVENAFFRYKSIIGEALRARSPGGQAAETFLACNVLNQMTELGRPQSYSIGR